MKQRFLLTMATCENNSLFAGGGWGKPRNNPPKKPHAIMSQKWVLKHWHFEIVICVINYVLSIKLLIKVEPQILSFIVLLLWKWHLTNKNEISMIAYICNFVHISGNFLNFWHISDNLIKIIKFIYFQLWVHIFDIFNIDLINGTYFCNYAQRLCIDLQFSLNFFSIP